jgi:uncharacterized DUF497 family protein
MGPGKESREPEEARDLFRGGWRVVLVRRRLRGDEHSVLEDRFIAIGPLKQRLVLVVWTERDEDTIRITSTRWATRREQSVYRAYMERTS